MLISSVKVFHGFRPSLAYFRAAIPSSSSNELNVLGPLRICSEFGSSVKGNFSQLKAGLGLDNVGFRTMAVVRDKGDITEDHLLVGESMDMVDDRQVAK